uniref:TLC domain-containing protein n=1 Tax=Ciona savignyi TaxID=51511 RepID=H2ZDG0_CIOSA
MMGGSAISSSQDALTVASFAVLFKIISMLFIKYLPVSKHATAVGKQFRWYNISVSLLHSLISSIGALYCFYLDPDLTTDIINRYTPEAHLIACFSTGYFIHDFFEAIQRKKISVTWEIIIHHTVVVICFGISVFTHKYVGYVIVALLCEINSVFLHIRQILNLCGTCQTTGVYRFNGILNITSYVLFRI